MNCSKDSTQVPYYNIHVHIMPSVKKINMLFFLVYLVLFFYCCFFTCSILLCSHVHTHFHFFTFSLSTFNFQSRKTFFNNTAGSIFLFSLFSTCDSSTPESSMSGIANDHFSISIFLDGIYGISSTFVFLFQIVME